MDKKEKFQLNLMEKEHKFQEDLIERKFKREKIFQIILVVLVSSLTILSSSISGYAVYRLTLDKEPYLILSPYDLNAMNNTFSIQIANIKETPATMIRLIYYIDGSTQKATAKPTNIPYLGKGNDFLEISVDELDLQLKNYCKITLEKFELEEFDSLGVGGRHNIILRLECNECNSKNFLQTSNIIYSKEVGCSYKANKKGIDYRLEDGYSFSY